MKHRPDSRGLLYFSIAVLSVWAGELANLGLGECRAPGCGCTRAKWWLATESCPLGKWGPATGSR